MIRGGLLIANIGVLGLYFGNIYNVRTGAQKVFGYWPKDGINKVNGVFDSAITFPSSAADIFPDLSTVP